jgi:FixJ family two-component response regulator
MPIIFITGYGDIPTTVQSMKAGAVEFLTKPLDEELPFGAIRHAIQRSRTAVAREADIQDSATVTGHSPSVNRR